ncbi:MULTISPECIES: alpha/beta fold hydrolase [Mumia]|uniref:alpha/beta fold hydrolase n=1 Tax=Mumia TaxID=1546255 RepID=UPI00141EB4D5|nr:MULTISPECIES: alpha/beta hydrolase [unclassified Mumia]QMW67173.1 alpha/beta hydrolase [Mumia sp. ZJ1417]
MAQVEVEGLRIAYERVGRGPELVLTQGFVGDGRSTWGRQADALADECTVILWDAPGAGRSSDPPEWFRITDYADCLAAFLRVLGIERAHLGGISFGAILELSAFQRHPGIVRSLVMAGGYAGWTGSLPAEEVEARLRTCLELAERSPEDFADAMTGSMFSRSAPPDAVAEFTASVRAFSPDGFRAMSLASAEADLRDVLPRVDVPTLLLHGEQDVRAPRAVADALHAGIPGSQLVVLPGVGHVSMVEAPDAVTHEIRRFLRSLDDRGVRGPER